MSVVGVDLGTLNTVIAVARNRGVDIVTNEVSNRATPTLIGFGPKSRYLGESAKTNEVSNLKNTVSSLKRLAGRSFRDPEVAHEQQYVSCPLVDVNGQVGAKVKYLGKEETFTATQLLSMFLGKVKSTASADLNLPVSDIVIAVPTWFTDAQRRSMLDAAEIAGLKVLRIINESTAIALGYGIVKQGLPEDKPTRVAFVDIGHSNLTCSIVAYKKGQLSVLSTASDPHFGGRDFDKALMDHFCSEFKEKYKIDVRSNPKATFRLAAAAEKLKKILSANSQAPLNIESIMNDVDVRSQMTREELEALMTELLKKTTMPLEKALADAGLKPEDIDVVEVVGGSSRVPALKEKLSQFFGKTLSFTLNADEAVARGCAFACAILSPVFRVRDFVIQDICSYPIQMAWEKSVDIPDEDADLDIFKRGDRLPSTKVLTFYRKNAFSITAQYKDPELLPSKTSPWLGSFHIKGVKPPGNGPDDFCVCKVRVRLNLHGVITVPDGWYVEDQEVEVEKPVEPEPKDKDVSNILKSASSKVKGFFEKKEKDPKSNAMDTDQSANGTAEEKPKTIKVKERKQVKMGELQITSGTSSLDRTTIDAYTEQESTMIMEDKLVADTEDRKNALEEYIYDMRAKIDELYSEFASEAEKEKLKAKLQETEDWLYDDGEDATKAVYIAKFDEVRFVSGPIVQRYLDKQEEERARIQKLREAEEEKIRKEVEARKRAQQEDEAARKKAAGGASAGGKSDPVSGAGTGTATPVGDGVNMEGQDAEMVDASEARKVDGEVD